MTSTSGPTSVVDRGCAMRRLVLVAVAALVIGGIRLTADAGQRSSPATPPPVIESMYGPDLYRHYCATCHGRDAKGGGPAAAAMKVPPPDLTVLARRRNGVFPSGEVESIIRGGTAITGHGSERDAGVGTDLPRTGSVGCGGQGAHFQPRFPPRIDSAALRPWSLPFASGAHCDKRRLAPTISDAYGLHPESARSVARRAR